MTAIKLIPSTDPLLHRPAEKVDTTDLSSLKALSKDLILVLFEHRCAGVSAQQIGVDMAAFAINVDGYPKVCFNPEIVASAVDMVKQGETCATFPGLVLKVNRPDAVVVKYVNADGNEVTEHLDGEEARTWLHEYDHTVGICFTDRVSKLSLGMANKKMMKAAKRGKK